ncbi:MAG: cellulase family glycosylhydrolase [Kiritimatiellae bacterium]|jgi:endoglucanase|nr:cellulase family glycosylhydrolase [Kiritimatiellia bacterium]
MAFEMQRGTNISHWLSQSELRGEERKGQFTKEDVTRLKGLGLDHLRLPIDEEQMWKENGEQEPEAWELLQQGLDWCREADLRAIVDLHILRSHHFVEEEGAHGKNTLFSDPKEADRLGQCWRELSAALKDRSNDWVAYELMNEAIADDPEDWNRVLQIPYNVIRKNEPERLIAIGSNEWCQVQTFPYLKVPEGDPNIILVVHFYNPMFITHNQAEWSENIREYLGPIQYPGQPVRDEIIPTLSDRVRGIVENNNEYYDAAAMAKALLPAIKKAAELNLPLWCNEFGVVDTVDDEIRKRWYRDFKLVMEMNNICWTNWDFRGQFGLFDKEHNSQTVVVDALLN